MKAVIIILIVLLVLFLLYILCLRCRRGKADWAHFRKWRYAHRGFHDREKGIPENSLAAFKRADELALAMEARGYRTDAPSRPGRRLSATWRDAAALVCCCLLWAVQILYL